MVQNRDTQTNEMLIGTFMVQNRDTQTNFLFGDFIANYGPDQAAAEYDNAYKSLDIH